MLSACLNIVPQHWGEIIIGSILIYYVIRNRLDPRLQFSFPLFPSKIHENQIIRESAARLEIARQYFEASGLNKYVLPGRTIPGRKLDDGYYLADYSESDYFFL